ncbi:MAG: DUF547 domain-containing protein [Deltaproteobacteria bacterium]|nr:DUF547 domain-containing protein [Deltaproteobacteria bacterium]
MKSRRWLLGGAAAAIAALVAARPALGVRKLPPMGTPAPHAFAAEYTRLLAGVVRGGAVDWEKLASEWAPTVEQLYATLAETGPDSTPSAFPDDDSRLAWAIDAYNLLVIVAVLRHWPLAGVGEVRGLIEPTAHFGFFYGLRLQVDGRWESLYRFERRLFAQFPDTRIHAAINCASVSCPPLLAVPFAGRPLGDALDGACRDWLRSPGVVTLRQADNTLLLPPLLGLYPDEFAADAARRGWGDTPGHWALGWLDEGRRGALREALDEGATPVIPPYDWGISRPA